jgi:tripartite-type tricarboxylate transporter receptor subunit TctC
MTLFGEIMKVLKIFTKVLIFYSLILIGHETVFADYPDKPVRVIVPFPPGGATDIVGREISEKLSQAFKQTFIVENKPGASGNIGIEMAARAPADGYTLVIGAPQTLTINPQLMKMSFDPQKELAPIVVIASVPNVLVVNPKLPVNSVRDLIALAKKQPGKLSYGSSSIGGTPHLSAEMFKAMTGTYILHIPYKGSSPALTDLMGGHIDFMFDNLPAALPFIQSGALKALAVTTLKRSPSLLNTPTMVEAGVPDFDSQGWFSLLSPTATPTEVLEKINIEVNKILLTDDFKAKLAKVGANPIGGSRSEFQNRIQMETKRWGSVIKAANIKAE